MPAPPLPTDEQSRLRTLLDMDLLDTPNKDVFDRLVEVAAKSMTAPMALISLVAERRQWFKARTGVPIDLTETPREVSFCAYAILTPDSILHVPDAYEDRRFYDNPLVRGPHKIRSYTGVPIIAPNGAALGAFCVLDTRPRPRPREDLERLRNLARVAAKFLALEASVRHIRARAEERECAIEPLHQRTTSWSTASG